MTPDTVFQLCNGIAMIGWIILIVLPKWHSSDKYIIGIIVALFAVIYTYYIVTNISAIDMKSFSSLKGVTALFTNPLAVLLGWVHYLAFDLFVGSWEVKDAQAKGISHWLVIPCLFLTFMFGPIGFLLYSVMRFFLAKGEEK